MVEANVERLERGRLHTKLERKAVEQDGVVVVGRVDSSKVEFWNASDCVARKVATARNRRRPEPAARQRFASSRSFSEILETMNPAAAFGGVGRFDAMTDDDRAVIRQVAPIGLMTDRTRIGLGGVVPELSVHEN